MRRPSKSTLGLTLAVGLAACCPTLWIQVYKGDPAPWPPVQNGVAADPPVLIPSRMQNRFDVLKDGTRVAFQPNYTDTFDQLANPGAAKIRAFDALAKILAAFDDKPMQVVSPTFSATVVCQNPSAAGLAANCQDLETATVPAALAKVGPDNPFVVTVKGRQNLIVNADASGCPTMLTLAKPIDVKDHASVEVELTGSLGLSAPLLSFIHLSDIQLRDPSVTLTNRRVSAQLDWFEPFWSFEYDTDMTFYNQYLVQSVIDTLNRLSALGTTPDIPTFVIHTGDSIDSGSMSELIRFHALIDELKIPFFEAFGNHDVLVFGNLTPTPTHDNDTACAPISSLISQQNWFVPNELCVDQKVNCPDCIGHEGELIARDTMEETRQRFMRQLKHSSVDEVAEPRFDPGDVYCPDTSPIVRRDAYSRNHGFDLGTANDKLYGTPLGYYAFVRPLAPTAGEDPRNAVFIALDSEELLDHQGGIEGRVGHTQLGWVKSVLDCVHARHPLDLVFAFAHQPLGSIDVASEDQKSGYHVLADTLASSPNFVGYFYGHNHVNSICGDGRSQSAGASGRACTHFWEVETASLIEFPQEGRLVQIKRAGKHLAFIEMSMVRERLADGNSDLAKFSALARQGAERDYCHNHPSPSCNTYKRPVRADGRDTDARLFFRLPEPPPPPAGKH